MPDGQCVIDFECSLVVDCKWLCIAVIRARRLMYPRTQLFRGSYQFGRKILAYSRHHQESVERAVDPASACEYVVSGVAHSRSAGYVFENRTDLVASLMPQPVLDSI